MPLKLCTSDKSAMLLPLMFAAASPVALIVTVSVPEFKSIAIPAPPTKFSVSTALSATMLF